MENLSIRNITDESGFFGAEPYIYTNGKRPYQESFRWFILHFTAENKAIENCPEGYNVNKYTTTKQYLG